MTVEPLPDPAHVPALDVLPDSGVLAAYLSITSATSADTLALLEDACIRAADYQLTRLSYNRMIAAGADPPATVPSPVAQAVLMYAAGLYRRRNSVNGFDGYDDLGTVPVRGSDPDIERLLDPYRALAWA